MGGEMQTKMDLAPLDALLENRVIMRSSKKDIIDDLALLRAFLMDPPEQFVEDGSLKELESLATEVGSIISSFDLKEMGKDMADELLSQLISPLSTTRRWIDAAEGFHEELKLPEIEFPTTGRIGFVDRVVENLKELVKDKADPIGLLKRFILRLQLKLQSLSSGLMEIPGRRKIVTNLAYKVEYAIDSFLVRDIPIWHCTLWLLNILKEFEQVELATTDNPTTDGNVVGFNAETETMLNQLVGGTKKLQIISIVGMAGQGKTTLAKKLYVDLLVVNYFDARAWCCVSQIYETKELLLELLGQVVQLSHTIRHKNDVELAELLYRSLRGRRFLVVLDDMWSTGAWNDLRRCFPNDNNGSRIIFTTRQQGLASEAQYGSKLQPLGPLSDCDSWALLEKKLFQKESCPPELLDVGWKIAKNCKGLPLSIVLTAGILAKMEKKEDKWKQIAETLSSPVLHAEAQGIVELSYQHLPYYLKPCFLYFGAFLEDREIPVLKLIRFWIAEGFIKHTASKNLEDVAVDYLMDLIGRSLVTVAQERSNGGVKSCRVHDLLREFCLKKAKQENFLQLIHGYDEHLHKLDHGLDPNYSHSSSPIIYHLRRLCIYSRRDHFIMLKPSGPLVRSLLFFAANDMCPTHAYDISFISQNFKLLRILDLEDIIIGDSFKAIHVLVHLRYLAVQGYFDFIPSSIANLKNLENFIVKGIRAIVVKVPGSIWTMSKLRHLHINDSVSFDMGAEKLENFSILDNLQTFSSPSLAHGDNVEKMIKRLRGIRKLKCIFLDSWDNARNCNRFPELELLSQLASIKVFYNGTGKYPCEFNFPSNLKKLTLSNFCMPWSEISQLADLRHLEVLKLLCKACEGEIWKMENVFKKLKFLKLDTLNIVEWSATDDHFPHLERLVLCKCEKLQGIPLGFGDIDTLQMIEVMWCSHSVATSATQIQEKKLDFGDEGLKIYVHPKILDLESLS